MRGLVLAAGFGTRLQPITDILPKALVPICGVPLVEIAFRYLRKNAFNDLALNMHYQHELVTMFLDYLPYPVTRFHEETLLGTGGAIWNARDFLFDDRSFCVMNADIVTNAPLKSLAKEFEESGVDIVLLASKDRGEKTIGIDAQNCYVGRVDDLFAPSQREAAFIGISFYRSAILDLFQEDDFDIKTVWKRAVECGYRVEVWDLESIYWQDTGTPQQLSQVYWDVLDKKISFDFPLGMEIDFEHKCAWSQSLPASTISPQSRYVWAEQILAPAPFLGERAILHGGVAINRQEYRDCIVTPWCEVSCESSK